MKKIGIITLYHNNINYGGLLQAYALAKFINSMGYCAEQILTDFISSSDDKFWNQGSGMLGSMNKFIKHCIYIFNKKNFINRRATFQRFENKIPHSQCLYNKENIKDSNLIYDAFITGSDQVWNVSWYRPEYFLSFVENKPRISYSASMPNTLDNKYAKIVKEHLDKFDSISVREKQTVSVLEELTEKKVKQVVDPTLLLDTKDWDKICTKRLVNKPYIFCYLLSTNRHTKKEIDKVARLKNMQIVTLPNVGGINAYDCVFGDIKLYNVSPEEFISLIKYSSYVITDSFHATVFSCLYRKQFVAISRAGKADMNSRLYSLLDMFDAKERFLNNETDYKQIETNLDKQFIPNEKNFSDAVKDSKQFLTEALSRV